MRLRRIALNRNAGPIKVPQVNFGTKRRAVRRPTIPVQRPRSGKVKGLGVSPLAEAFLSFNARDRLKPDCYLDRPRVATVGSMAIAVRVTGPRRLRSKADLVETGYRLRMAPERRWTDQRKGPSSDRQGQVFPMFQYAA